MSDAAPPRPSYVHCVSSERLTRERLGLMGKDLPELGPRATWCGRMSSAEFRFTSADHALNTALARDRLMVCPECAREMTGALYGQTWHP